MKKILLSLVLIALLTPNISLAANFTFQPQQLGTPQEKPFTVTVVLDTETESINAVEGVLVLTKEMGDVVTITDSGSIVTYWVTRPEWDVETRSISFSGGIPSGYSGQAGILFSVVFPSYLKGELSPAMSLSQLKAYVNDGLGTTAQTRTKFFAFGEGGSSANPEIAGQLYIDDKKPDDIAPEVFSPQVSRDDRVFDGKWFISFATTDKQSGIDHYEIQESITGSIDSGDWKIATSPYVLTDQNLNSFIFVLAVDRQGNEKIIQVYPRNPLSWYARNSSMIIGIGGVILTASILSVLYKRKRKTNSSLA